MYQNSDSIRGKVSVTLDKGKIEHTGIRLELIGQIEIFNQRTSPHRFYSIAREVAPAGHLSKPIVYDFSFENLDAKHETYQGKTCRLRYFLTLTIFRSYNTNITKDFDFCVWNRQIAPAKQNPIKMEVGIEKCLHIEFYYARTHFHLQDIILGKIYFILVRIKIKYMEISLMRREVTGIPPNQDHDSQTIARFEIMDGVPVKDEVIPVRMPLAGYHLTPTFRDVHNKYSVQYFLNLILVDNDNRRYYKQSEVILYRHRVPKVRSGAADRSYKSNPHSLSYKARAMLAPPKARARTVKKNADSPSTSQN